jgi:predicted RNase H-like HicB family nuclease
MLKFALTGYIEEALARAEYDKLDDGSFSGRIPGCKGVIAFGKTLRECENELRSTLEDWVQMGLKLGHSLPVIGAYDLNREPTSDQLAAV